MREGVVVGGVRRAVRLLVSGDYEALCTVHEHKGPNATMPWLTCYCTRAPSRMHAALDGIYGTMQDVDAPSPAHARTSAHLVSMAARADGPANDQSQATLRSIARPPLFSVDPRQIVPISLQILHSITLQLLRLAIELVISCRGRPVGSAFSFELAEKLRRVVRVRPAPYNGGLLIGRDCHAIAQRSDVICRALLSLVAESDPVAYNRLWVLWRGISRTMSRVAEVHASEALEFRSNVQLFVRHLKRSFPWVNISPKLHVLMYHPPDFLYLFGSICLYG